MFYKYVKERKSMLFILFIKLREVIFYIRNFGLFFCEIYLGFLIRILYLFID